MVGAGLGTVVVGAGACVVGTVPQLRVQVMSPVPSARTAEGALSTPTATKNVTAIFLIFIVCFLTVCVGCETHHRCCAENAANRGAQSAQAEEETSRGARSAGCASRDGGYGAVTMGQ